MKRKFVKVMFFGALALSTVTYVGCKDYDDDVKGLQEQIDNINQKGADVTTEAMTTAIKSAIAGLQSQLDAIASKADKTAVEELKSTVRDLQTAVDGKASQADLTALSGKLTEAIDKVNTSIDSKVGAAKDELQAKIDKLQEDLEKADQDAAAAVAAELVKVRQELKDLNDATGEKLADLSDKIEQLQSLESRIEDLEAANENFVTINQLNDYMNSAAVKKYVDDVLVDYLTSDEVTDKVGAVQEYVDGQFKTEILAKISTTYLSLGTYNEDMEALQQQISKFVDSQSTEYKKIFTDITSLQEYKTDVLEVLVKSLSDDNTIAKANKCAEVLGDIESLSDELAKCAKTDDLKNYVKSSELNGKIDAHLKDKFAGYDSKIEDIEGSISDLTSELTNMVKSIVYIPESVDRSVSFNTLYAKFADGGDVIDVNWLPVVSVNQVQVKFRVSPASAVTELVKYDKANPEACRYNVNTDYQALTRASGEFFTISKIEKGAEDNIILVTLDAGQAVKNYAIALTLIDRGDKPLNNISSDYFAAVKKNKFIQSVAWTTSGTMPTVLNNDGATPIDYKAEGYGYKITVSDETDGSNPQSDLTPEDLQIPASGIFEVAFAFNISGNPSDAFSLSTDGKLSVNKSTDDATRLGKVCTITSTVTVNALDASTKSYAPTSFSAVTIKSELADYTASKASITGAWSGISTPKEYLLADEDITAILTALDVANFDAASITTSTPSAGGVTLAVQTAHNNKLVVKVSESTIYEDDVVASISANNKTIKVTVPGVKIAIPEKFDLSEAGGMWNQDGSVNLVVEPTYNTSEKLQSIKLTREFSQIIGNYATVSAALGEDYDDVFTYQVIGGVTQGEVAANKLTVATTATDNVTVTMSVTCTAGATSYVVASKTINFAPISSLLTSTLVEGNDAEHTAATKGEVVTFSTTFADFTWSDRRGKVMWPTPNTTYFDPATAAGALAIYGYSMDVKLSGDMKDYFELAGDKTTVKIKSGLTIQAPASDISVDVVFTPTVKWGEAPAPVTKRIIFPKELFN
jgi:hypothetical protein